jgi:hypothetical protein
VEWSWERKAVVLRWLAWELREDIAELFLLVSGDTHSPKNVLDVQFAEEDGALRGRP